MDNCYLGWSQLSSQTLGGALGVDIIVKRINMNIIAGVTTVFTSSKNIDWACMFYNSPNSSDPLNGTERFVDSGNTSVLVHKYAGLYVSMVWNAAEINLSVSSSGGSISFDHLLIVRLSSDTNLTDEMSPSMGQTTGSA